MTENETHERRHCGETGTNDAHVALDDTVDCNVDVAEGCIDEVEIRVGARTQDRDDGCAESESGSAFYCEGVKIFQTPYMNPRRKMQLTLTFPQVESLSRQTGYRGRVRIPKSRRMFGMLLPSIHVRRSIHRGLRMLLSQAAATGIHWKIVTNIIAMPQEMTRPKNT